MKELDPENLYPINDDSNLGQILFGKFFSKQENELVEYNITKNEYFNRISLCSYVVSKAWMGEKLDSKAVVNFASSLRNRLILFSFPRILESFRIMKKFEYSSCYCSQLKELIMICLTECYNKRNVTVPLDIINLCGTFHSKKCPKKMRKKSSQCTVETQIQSSRKESMESGILFKEKKKQLSEEIKSHKIFSKVKFWETCLIYSLKTSRDKFDFHDTSFSIDQKIIKKNFISQITRTFMGQILQMQEFGFKNEAIEDLSLHYIERYQLPNQSVKELLVFLKENVGLRKRESGRSSVDSWKLFGAGKKKSSKRSVFKVGVDLLKIKIGNGI